MPKTLDQAIAKLLAASNVGMFRKEIFDAIDKKLTDGNIEKVSAALNKMQMSGNVDKGTFISGNGCRWNITKKGRMYYSDLHDDAHEKPQTDQKTLSEVSENTPETAKTMVLGGTNQPNTPLPVVLDVNPKPSVGTMDASDEIPATEQNYQKQKKTIHFDLTDELDRGLCGIVELIRHAANQALVTTDLKAEKLALLERLENNDLYPTNTRDLLGHIRRDIEQLDDAV